MTKRRPKTESEIVRASSANTVRDVYASLLEQLFAMDGPETVARLLADRLRDPAPHPDVIATVARWLDPQTDDYMKLVVVGRRDGKRTTKRVNDATIAKVAMEYQQALGNKHGDQKKAVKEVAKHYGVSKAAVLKALRSK
jgi:hypothetical protein